MLTGTDIDDAALTETVSITASAGTYSGVKAFKTFDVTYGAGTGNGATIAIGYKAVFGLSNSIAVRAGRPAVWQEVAAGSVVTNGTIVAPATSAPHGTYAPNAAPNGSNDYSLTYEHA